MNKIRNMLKTSTFCLISIFYQYILYLFNLNYIKKPCYEIFRLEIFIIFTLAYLFFSLVK